MVSLFRNKFLILCRSSLVAVMCACVYVFFVHSVSLWNFVFEGLSCAFFFFQFILFIWKFGCFMIVQTGRYMFYIAYRWLHKLLIRKKKRTFFCSLLLLHFESIVYTKKKPGENLSINFFVTFDGENCVTDWVVVCMCESLDRLHTNANWWFADDVVISCDTLANIKITQSEICIQVKPTVNFRLENMPNTCACVYI